MIDWNRNGKIDPVDVGISIALDSQKDIEFKELSGYPFQFIQELEPNRNLLGEIKQYNPQENYNKKATVPLHKYGKGPFCRFSLNSKDYGGISGVYLMCDGKDILYIGQTANFQQRFDNGYGNIAPRNCYIGGQNTNCKINKMILNKYIRGERVYLYFFVTPDYDQVEHQLIKVYQPPYNGSVFNESLFSAPQKSIYKNEDKKKGRSHMNKYEPLNKYLSRQTASRLILSFDEIEHILGDKLPKSAHCYSVWWSNSNTSAHPHSCAWLDAKYKTVNVLQSMLQKQMTFEKI